MRAKDLIGRNERAVAVRTTGKHFVVNRDGSGETGHWVMSPAQQFDKVIIFHEQDGAATKVYIANNVGRELSVPVEKRYKLLLRDCRRVGETNVNWATFAETTRNPVRYVSAR